MADEKTGMKTTAIPLCDMILGMLIIAQIPLMFGVVSGAATVGVIPWVLMAYPMIIVCVVLMFKNGELIDATINGVLSAVLMGQNAVTGTIYLVYTAAGQAIPAEVSAGMALISAFAYLVGAIILIPIGWLAFHGTKVGGTCILCAGVGFLALFFLYMGFGSLFGLIAAIGLQILAVYLLLTGISMLFPKKPAPQE